MTFAEFLARIPWDCEVTVLPTGNAAVLFVHVEREGCTVFRNKVIAVLPSELEDALSRIA